MPGYKRQVKYLKVRRIVYEQSHHCVLVSMNTKLVRAVEVKKRSPQRSKEEDHLLVKAKVKCLKPYGSGKTRHVIVKLYDLEEKRFINRRVWVYCDCEDFLYRCEYVLAMRGQSQLKKCLPKAPVHTNPKMKPWICKHIYLVLYKLSKGTYIPF